MNISKGNLISKEKILCNNCINLNLTAFEKLLQLINIFTHSCIPVILILLLFREPQVGVPKEHFSKSKSDTDTGTDTENKTNTTI